MCAECVQNSGSALEVHLGRTGENAREQLRRGSFGNPGTRKLLEIALFLRDGMEGRVDFPENVVNVHGGGCQAQCRCCMADAVLMQAATAFLFGGALRGTLNARRVGFRSPAPHRAALRGRDGNTG